MALIYRCDRCGNETEFEKTYVMTMTDRLSDDVARAWDLCVWCKNTILQPLDAAKEARRVRGDD